MLEKYLEHYAEKEARTLSYFGDEVFDEVVVLPFLDEGECFPAFFESLKTAAAMAKRTFLLVIVVNCRDDHGEEVISRHKAFLEITTGPNVLIVDRTGPEKRFLKKEGVGLARKIGCDVAVRLWREERIKSSLMRSVDADVIFPSDYFLETTSNRVAGIEESRLGSFVYPFRHELDSLFKEENEALRLYDIHLRYYQAGLSFAGSPYSFPALGSILAIPFLSYCAVRGFPKLEAAEDFYLLNKLAQYGRIEERQGTPLRIRNRRSRRVPFGTGSSIPKIVSQLQSGTPYSLYHPEIFLHLRAWIDSMFQFSSHRNLDRLALELEREHCPSLPAIRAATSRALATRPDRAGLMRHLMTWFDGLKTLQAVHALRDRELPNLPWEEAIERSEFKPLVSRWLADAKEGGS